MTEYQTALDKMGKASTEYVRGIPVVKVFQQTVYTFKLPKYDSHGNVISYTVKEHEVPGYVSEINKKADGSYEVVNTWKGSDDNGGGTKPGGKANTAAEKGGPVTGDDSHTALWFTAMLISCSLLTANIVFLKKRRKER